MMITNIIVTLVAHCIVNNSLLALDGLLLLSLAVYENVLAGWLAIWLALCGR
mgnify:FL=1